MPQALSQARSHGGPAVGGEEHASALADQGAKAQELGFAQQRRAAAGRHLTPLVQWAIGPSLRDRCAFPASIG
ncbi:hypothetical protein D3C79_881980 [compost metagenome]